MYINLLQTETPAPFSKLLAIQNILEKTGHSKLAVPAFDQNIVQKVRPEEDCLPTGTTYT
jgi:hypothetical protein